MKANQTKGWKAGVLVLLCAALTACSSSGNTGSAADDKPDSSGSKSNTSKGGKTVVSMTVMTKDRFLEEAEQKFESAHPDIDIQIEETVPVDTGTNGKMVMMGPDSGPTPEQVDKYVNTVNTAIMSGKAADIISVEHLPGDKYAEKGLLADWNELTGKDGSFRKSDYYENIFNGVAKGGGWYGIPTSFSLDVMIGNASLLKQHSLDDKTWTWDQFVELLEKQGQSEKGKFGISMVKPEDLLSYLVETVYGKLVEKDGNSVKFDADAFQTYMEEVKKLYDNKLATAENTGPGSTSFSHVNMMNPIDIVMLPEMKGGDNGKLLLPPGTGQDEGIPFKSNQVLALNAKSKVKEPAWEFVKFLLSEEMQSSNSLFNFAVHKEALKKKLKEMQEMMSGGKAKMMIKTPDGENQAADLTDEDIEQILSVIPSVGKYGNKDPKVLSMIREESAAYFSGNKTADAVAGLLANRVTTYLNE